jgi:putative hydrolase of the HAD superfamily
MVIVLDLDDTLILEYDYVLSGFAAIDSWICEKTNVKGFVEAATIFFQNKKNDPIGLALYELGILFNEEDIKSKCIQIYRDHLPKISLCKDADYFLKSCLQRSTKLALITDGRPTGQMNKINAVGLGRYIKKEHMVLTGEKGPSFSKPSLYAYEKVMSLFEHERDFIYIADNPQKDFIAPQKLGWMPSIRINREKGIYSSYESNVCTVESFNELCGVEVRE